MTHEYDHEVLFIPGPVEVRREILDAQGAWLVGHRSGAFADLYAGLQPKLKASYGAGDQHRVYIYTSSGSGIWESASRCCVRDNQSILHLVNGAFSDRWAQVSKANGKKVDAIEVDWGQAIKPEQVAAALKAKHYDAVAMVYNETSTGVLNPGPEIGAIIKEHENTFFLVDVVSAWLGTEVNVTAWGIDVALASSQKALALPPGIAFGAVSDRVLERAKEIPYRGYYFDVLTLEKNHLRNNTPTTAPIALMNAADVQLDAICREGFAARFQRHADMSAQTQQWVADRGFAMFSEAGYHSPTVSAIRNTHGIDFPALQSHLRERNIMLGGGYGKLKGETFRIAHMGDTTADDMDRLFAAIDEFID